MHEGNRRSNGSGSPEVLRACHGHWSRDEGDGVRGSHWSSRGSFGLTRVLDTFLFHVAPTDPSIFVLAGVVLAGVAVAACYIPACCAARIDPIVALRCEITCNST